MSNCNEISIAVSFMRSTNQHERHGAFSYLYADNVRYRPPLSQTKLHNLSYSMIISELDLTEQRR